MCICKELILRVQVNLIKSRITSSLSKKINLHVSDSKAKFFFCLLHYFIPIENNQQNSQSKRYSSDTGKHFLY